MPGDQQTTVLDGQVPALDVSRLRARLAGAAVASGVTFAFVTALVWFWPRLSIDRSVLNWVDNEVFTRGPVSFVLAHLGSARVVTPLVIVACAWFVLRWRAVVPAVILSSSYLLVSVTVTVTKELVRRPEPTKPSYALGYSYPSGHAGASTVGWLGFAFCWWLLNAMAGSEHRQRFSAVVGIIVAAAVWAMMLVRSAHWLTDLVGGVALGVACTSTVAAIALTARVTHAIERLTPGFLSPPVSRS